jgi:hypothetical protein
MRCSPVPDLQGILFTPDGAVSVVQRPTQQDTLRWLYGTIGCHTVDVVELGDGLSLWLDDEGLLTESPRLNLPATALAASFGDLRQGLYGPAVLLGGTTEDGDTLGLSDETVKGIVSRYGDPNASQFCEECGLTVDDGCPHRGEEIGA